MPRFIPDDDDEVQDESLPVNGNGNGSTTPSPRIVSNGKEAQGSERLAVNVLDLDRIPGDVRAMMGLAHLVDATKGIRVDKDRPDEFAVAFKCPLLQAACLLDVIRGHDRQLGDYPTRAYLLKSGGRTWTKLPAEAVLTLVGKEGRARLNATYFTVKTLPGEIIPLPME